ncbi:MAG: putative metal ABC transporter substrate-binding protein Hpf [Chloroflexi bacterium]|nr:putative metal ABC transporter substrate-binding protein Hpf [Chloroflexota bacterium]
MLKKIVSVAVLVMVLPLVAACPAPAETPAEAKIGVVVSILPLADFVGNIGGERVDVTVMVPPGASPHTFAPTPGQMRAVSGAKLFVKVGSGLGFERAWMDRIIEQNRDMPIVDSSHGIELMEMVAHCPHEENDHEGEEHEREHHHHGGMDPHIWLSLPNARIMVQNIRNGLMEIDPEHADYYTKNTERYLQELDALDQYIRERLDGFLNRYFLIYHPAFGYFARDYNLTQLAIEHEGKEPTPKVIMEAIDLAVKHNLSYVFVSPQHPVRHAETIARSINAQTASIDELPRYFIPSMRNVADSLAREMME